MIATAGGIVMAERTPRERVSATTRRVYLGPFRMNTK
jgi:hypothetical protein